MERRRNPRGPFEQARSDGTWLLVDEKRLSDGGTMTLATDITQLKNHERELMESERRFHDFATTGSDVFWEQDADLRYVWISSEGSMASRYDTSSAIGKTISEVPWFGVREEDWDTLKSKQARREPFRDFIIGRFDLLGRPRHLSVSGQPVIGVDGALTGYRGTARDVTELVEANARLKSAFAQADRSNRAKSDFLSRMSHELRTPLNPILAYSDMLWALDDASLPQEKRKAYAESINASARHLNRLIDGMFDLELIESGQWSLEPRPTNPRALVDRVFGIVRQEASRKDVSLDLAQELSAISLRSDQQSVSRILLNLVANAISAAPPQSTVHVAIAQGSDGSTVFTIRDVGAGITRSLVEALRATPAPQADDPMRARETDGTLGLRIAYGLTRHLGGQMRFSWPDEGGTEIRVTLPSLSDDDATVERLVTQLIAADTAGRRVATLDGETLASSIIWNPASDQLELEPLAALGGFVDRVREPSGVVATDAFDIRDLEPIAGWLMLLDVVEDGAEFRYLSYGSGIASVVGRDHTGTLLGRDSRTDFRTIQFYRACYRSMIRKRASLPTRHEARRKPEIAYWSRYAVPICDPDSDRITRKIAANVPKIVDKPWPFEAT